MQPKELWGRTGRSNDYGPTIFCLNDRHGKGNVLSPTAEEVVTYIAAGEIRSYKQLPINLYQISAKFRDEFRPRFGPIRSREFMMKDAYSFDADPAGLDKSYKAMYDAYCRIFKRCGLQYVIVEAEVGEMGGSGSHQFTVPCESGEDTIVYTEDNSYAANLQRADVDPLPSPVIPSERSESRNLFDYHRAAILQPSTFNCKILSPAHWLGHPVDCSTINFLGAAVGCHAPRLRGYALILLLSFPRKRPKEVP